MTSEYFDYFNVALLAKDLLKMLCEGKQTQKKHCLELPECFQFLLLGAECLWLAVGGVFQHSVRVSLFSFGLYLCMFMCMSLYTLHIVYVFSGRIYMLPFCFACGSGDHYVAFSFVMVNRPFLVCLNQSMYCFPLAVETKEGSRESRCT